MPTRQTNLSTLLLLFFFLLPAVAIASTPPSIPTHLLPPPVTPTTPDHPPSVLPPLAVPPAPFTLEMLNRQPVSGAIYADLLQSLGPAATPQHTSTQTVGSSRIGSFATSQPPIRVTNDAPIDVETAVVAVNYNGIAHTATTAIKYTPVAGLGNVARVYAAATTDFSNFTRNELLLPPSGVYNRSADPLMSLNPYNGGIAPKRMYTVGVMHNGSAQLYSAIGVWQSDNGGMTWSYPTSAEIQGGGNVFVDKPAIAVSWHNGVDLGYVYIAYIRIDFNTGVNVLVVERSTDGGISFFDPFVITYGQVSGPQLVVDTATGAVHILWTDIATREIRKTASTDFADNFGAHEVVGDSVHWGFINPQVRANSNSAARFHWPTGRIIVAWHGDGPAGTDIFYSYKPCSQDCNYWGWRNKIQVNDVSTNDQFMPGMDFNTAGEIIIAFYDRRDDPENIRYHEYYAYITPDGNALQANANISSGFPASDPREHQSAEGPDAQFLGDYQDVWDWVYTEGERAVPSFILIPGGGINGEVYLTRITY